ncbi:DUF2267 domain-containing protein [Streptoalloteichus hindustanus]|uniref:Uncharacterized conserved protein, DUF2267 family n=1 Tax=Streptoalloteichus hindustanus TaxID=2017 RepID=A0A1M5AIH4_STRHI|nr:DUF2267 domain-containing protein [Streptoalloteichus hindustanus]SHF30071.1 Uncharacterized conserved protein, DUF2267 family [Streptoalloteichus hindustanus]
MRHDEFIGQVQNRARLGSRGAAERVTRAALETLGERIPEGLCESVAGQLPQEIAEHLRRTEVFGGQGTGERFDLDEFLNRVVRRSGEDRPQAAFHTRVVMEVVGEATGPTVMSKLGDSLPDDLRRLVTSGSQGEMGA